MTDIVSGSTEEGLARGIRTRGVMRRGLRAVLRDHRARSRP